MPLRHPPTHKNESGGLHLKSRVEGFFLFYILRFERPEAVFSLHYDLIKQLKIIILSTVSAGGNDCLPFQFLPFFRFHPAP
jgi:hypothetical protein